MSAAVRGRGRPRIGTRIVVIVPDDVLDDIDRAAGGPEGRADEVRRRLAAPLGEWRASVLSRGSRYAGALVRAATDTSPPATVPCPHSHRSSLAALACAQAAGTPDGWPR